MHHKFRPIDLHAPSLCPSQLVLQERRKTVWGLRLAADLAHTHTPTTWGSVQIYIQRTQRVCEDILSTSSTDFCFIELLQET